MKSLFQLHPAVQAIAFALCWIVAVLLTMSVAFGVPAAAFAYALSTGSRTSILMVSVVAPVAFGIGVYLAYWISRGLQRMGAMAKQALDNNL